MKPFSLKLCLLSISVALSLAFASGQAVTEEWLKSEWTVLLAGYISWPDEAEIDTFQIGVLASQPIYVQMSLKSGLDSRIFYRAQNIAGPITIMRFSLSWGGKRKSPIPWELIRTKFLRQLPRKVILI